MPTLWGLSSDSAKPAATPASTALPPASSRRKPDRRGQVVSRGDHAQRALQHRASGEWNRSAFADSAPVRVNVSAEGARGR